MKDSTLQLMQLRERRNSEIVRQYKTGKWTAKALGERYGVSTSCVLRVLRIRMGRKLGQVGA